MAASPSRWVFREVAADENEFWAEFARSSSRHSASNAESLRLVGRGEHDAPAHRDGLAAQGWIEKLLNRGVKSVQVGMKDRGVLHRTAAWPPMGT